jgi:hypothetical protein
MVAPTTVNVDASEKKTAVIRTITHMDENHPKIHDLYRDLVELNINNSPINSLYSFYATIINLEIKTSRLWEFICSLFIRFPYAWLTYNCTLKMPNTRELSEKEQGAARLTQFLYLISTVYFCVSVPWWYRYVCARRDRPKSLTMCSFCAQTSLHSGPAWIVITRYICISLLWMKICWAWLKEDEAEDAEGGRFRLLMANSAFCLALLGALLGASKLLAGVAVADSTIPPACIGAFTSVGTSAPVKSRGVCRTIWMTDRGVDVDFVSRLLLCISRSISYC